MSEAKKEVSPGAMEELLRQLERERDISKNNLRRIRNNYFNADREAMKETERIEETNIETEEMFQQKLEEELKEQTKEYNLALNHFEIDKQKNRKNKIQEVEKLEFEYNSLDTKNNRKKEHITAYENETSQKLDFQIKEVNKEFSKVELSIKEEGKKNAFRISNSRNRVISENEMTIKEVSKEFDNQLSRLFDIQNNIEADYSTSMSLVNKNLTSTLQLINSQKSRIENSHNSACRPLRNQMNRDLTAANANLASAIEQRDPEAEDEARTRIAEIEAEFNDRMAGEEAKRDEMIAQQVEMELDTHVRSISQRADVDRQKLHSIEKNNRDIKTKRLLQDVTTRRLDVERDLRLLELDNQRDINFLTIEKELEVNKQKNRLEVAKVDLEIKELDFNSERERVFSDIDTKITKAQIERQIKEANYIAENKDKVAHLERDIKVAKIEFQKQKLEIHTSLEKERELVKSFLDIEKYMSQTQLALIEKMNGEESECFNRAKATFLTEFEIADLVRDESFSELESKTKKNSTATISKLSERAKSYGRDVSNTATQLKELTNSLITDCNKIIYSENRAAAELTSQINLLFTKTLESAKDRFDSIHDALEKEFEKKKESVNKIVNDAEEHANKVLTDAENGLKDKLDELNGEIQKMNDHLEYQRKEADEVLESVLQSSNDEKERMEERITTSIQEARTALEQLQIDVKESIANTETRYQEEVRELKHSFTDEEHKFTTGLDDFEYEIKQQIEALEGDYTQNIKDGEASIEEAKAKENADITAELKGA